MKMSSALVFLVAMATSVVSGQQLTAAGPEGAPPAFAFNPVVGPARGAAAPTDFALPDDSHPGLAAGLSPAEAAAKGIPASALAGPAAADPANAAAPWAAPIHPGHPLAARLLADSAVPGAYPAAAAFGSVPSPADAAPAFPAAFPAGGITPAEAAAKGIYPAPILSDAGFGSLTPADAAAASARAAAASAPWTAPIHPGHPLAARLLADLAILGASPAPAAFAPAPSPVEAFPSSPAAKDASPGAAPLAYLPITPSHPAWSAGITPADAAAKGLHPAPTHLAAATSAPWATPIHPGHPLAARLLPDSTTSAISPYARIPASPATLAFPSSLVISAPPSSFARTAALSASHFAAASPTPTSPHAVTPLRLQADAAGWTLAPSPIASFTLRAAASPVSPTIAASWQPAPPPAHLRHFA